jgi:hypothetical protein
MLEVLKHGDFVAVSLRCCYITRLYPSRTHNVLVFLI